MKFVNILWYKKHCKTHMIVNHEQGIKINHQCKHCEYLLLWNNAIKTHMTKNHEFRNGKGTSKLGVRLSLKIMIAEQFIRFWVQSSWQNFYCRSLYQKRLETWNHFHFPDRWNQIYCRNLLGFGLLLKITVVPPP